MSAESSDIPERFRGNESLIVAELDGTPMLLSDNMNMTIQTQNGPKHSSELPVTVRIDGLTEEAVQRIGDIVESWHPATGTPFMQITRANLLKALVADTN